MSNIYDDRFRNIMKINGFIKQGIYYNRDDGFQIEFTNKEPFDYSLVNSEGKVNYFQDRLDLVGFLCLKGIINRLF